jgi:ferrochelatase
VPPYDALLVVSFGGPEAPEEVLPFLRQVTRGREVPEDRLAAVAAQYAAVGGVSPLNGQNRALVAALRERLDLPVYWGNRNAAPWLSEAFAAMRDDGRRHALAFVTSAFASYSGCRQYREDLARAQQAVGAGAPAVDKLRVFYNHPLFVAAVRDATLDALGRLPPALRGGARLVFTGHSIPLTMAAGCAYEAQLRDVSAQVAAACGERPWVLAFQSRSGAPSTPWLGPDVGEVLTGPGRAVVVVPIGFVSDHLEVVHDLDTVAVPAARAAGFVVERAATAGLALVPLVAALVAERTAGADRCATGSRGPSHDGCPLECCLPGT